MTYSAQETSLGTPYYLYRIQVGSLTFFYTNFDQLVNFDTNVWQPLAGISHDDIDDDLLADTTSTKIKLPFDSDLAEILLKVNLGDVLNFTIYRGHAATGDTILVYQGEMTAYSIELPYFIIHGDRSFGNIVRPSATLAVASKCNVPLYGRQCGVDKEAFKETVTFVSRTGSIITVDGLSSAVTNWYAGGYIEFNTGVGVSSKVNIDTSTGDQLALDQRIPVISVGTEITVYLGCDHLWQGDCLNKFNNTINNPAFPFMNSRNPFNGAKLY